MPTSLCDSHPGRALSPSGQRGATPASIPSGRHCASPLPGPRAAVLQEKRPAMPSNQLCRSLEDCAQGLGCRKLVGGGEASGARSCAVTGLRLGFQLVQCSGYGAAERNSFWCQETGHRPPSFGLVTDHQMGTCRFDSQVRPRSGRAPAWAPCPCLTQALRGAGRLHSRRRWQSAAPQQLKHRLAAQLLPPAPTWWLAACACMPALRRQHGASGRQQS